MKRTKKLAWGTFARERERHSFPSARVTYGLPSEWFVEKRATENVSEEHVKCDETLSYSHAQQRMSHEKGIESSRKYSERSLLCSPLLLWSVFFHSFSKTIHITFCLHFACAHDRLTFVHGPRSVRTRAPTKKLCHVEKRRESWASVETTISKRESRFKWNLNFVHKTVCCLCKGHTCRTSCRFQCEHTFLCRFVSHLWINSA